MIGLSISISNDITGRSPGIPKSKGEVLAKEYEIRVLAAGGVYENDACLIAALNKLNVAQETGIELITNGNFANGATDWNTENGVFTIGGGVANGNGVGGGPNGHSDGGGPNGHGGGGGANGNSGGGGPNGHSGGGGPNGHGGGGGPNGHGGNGGSEELSQNFSTDLTQGKTYEVVFDLLNYVSGSVQFVLTGGGSLFGLSRASNGAFTQSVVVLGDNNKIKFRGANFEGSITNISLKEVL